MAYEEASGSGNVKAGKVQQRLRVMYLAMCDYCRINPLDYGKPFAEGIPLYLDGMGSGENSEADSEGASPAAENESDAENSECERKVEDSSGLGVESDAGDASEVVSGDESTGEGTSGVVPDRKQAEGAGNE